MIRSILSIACLCAATALVGCGSNNNSGSGSGTSSGKAISTLDVTPAVCGLTHSSSLQMTAEATYADSAKADVTPDVTWASSDEKIATITSTGNLVGVGTGTVKITATMGSTTGEVTCGVL